ncbi:hypothetical protein [Lactobacillus melliventris]|uniref:Aminotransferase class I/classII domain-containing protein n=1 Tax=Lactobacillus melliventris TaxID=1218507 RepID=A0A0F4L7V3_9LACO|nr:hypothetical protein [Lactobacillus melliventris]KJY54700.1 hypothetical protein JF74_18750 [Lactobacillus melliventris]
MKSNNSYSDEVNRLRNIAKAFKIDYNFNLISTSDYVNIHKFVKDIRAQIMQKEFSASIDRMKSPEFKHGKGISQSYFSYERAYVPYSIETLITKSFKSTKVSTFITRSGLSSIDLAFQVSIYFLHSVKNKLSSVSFYNYFETESLIYPKEHLGLIKNHNSTNFEKFLRLILKNDPEIIFIENPLAIPKVGTFNESRFLNTIEKLNPKKFRIIIFDSTLKGPLNNLEYLLNKLPGSYLIIDIVSGIKFYNLGLELSNLGITTIWCKDDYIRNQFKARSKVYRAMTGQTIEAVEESYLYPIFKNLKLVNDHYQAILRNSLVYQKQLYKSGIINKLLLTPIVTINNHWSGEQVNNTIHSIHDNLENRGLNLSTGDSFGFHLTRIQDIHTFDNKHWIRIAPGSFYSEVDDYIIKYLIKYSKRTY